MSFTNEEAFISNQRKKNKVLPFILEPHSCFKVIWGLIIILLIFYTATVTPYLMSFYDEPVGDEPYDFWKVMETLIDVIFAVDIFINFISAYERRDGTYEYSLKKIAANYLAGFFAIDFLASFPFADVMSETEPAAPKFASEGAAGNDDLKINRKANNLLKLARLQRLHRLFRIIRIVKLVNVENYSSSISNSMSKFKIGSQISRMLKIVGFVLITSHLFACFFYMAAKFQDFSDDTWVARNSRNLLNAEELTIYEWSLYWSFQTLTTVGYGDFGAITSYEMLITIVWMCIGVAIYSVVVGSLTSFISDEYFSNENLAMKLKALE